MLDLKYKLWKIKHWLQYEPMIYISYFLAKFFKILYELNDRLGYLLFGADKWKKLKEQENLHD